MVKEKTVVKEKIVVFRYKWEIFLHLGFDGLMADSFRPGELQSGLNRPCAAGPAGPADNLVDRRVGWSLSRRELM